MTEKRVNVSTFRDSVDTMYTIGLYFSKGVKRVLYIEEKEDRQ